MNLLKDDARAYIAEQYQTTRRKEFRLSNDYEFKAVFGQDNERSKQALMSLLNAILDRKDDPITNIRILNPIVIGQTDTSKEGICRRVLTLRSRRQSLLLSVLPCQAELGAKRHVLKHCTPDRGPAIARTSLG